MSSIPPTDMVLQDQVFMRNPLVVIAPLSHPLRKASQILLAALKEQKIHPARDRLGKSSAALR